MTNTIRRFALTTVTLASLAMPLSSVAFGGEMGWDPSDTGGIFQTPVRVRGEYRWVTPLSRRQIRKQAREERRTLIMRPVSRLELL